MGTEKPLIAVYPGSFDPVTNGHLDIIRRGAGLVDQLVVAVLNNTSKQPMFTLEQRKQMLRDATVEIGNVEIDSFGGLLVDYAARRNVRAILRGLRTVSDYETEMQMALLNRRMRAETETIFLLSGEEFSFISSRMVQEVIKLGGDVSQFVPEPVSRALRSRSA